MSLVPILCSKLKKRVFLQLRSSNRNDSVTVRSRKQEKSSELCLVSSTFFSGGAEKSKLIISDGLEMVGNRSSSMNLKSRRSEVFIAVTDGTFSTSPAGMN